MQLEAPRPAKERSGLSVSTPEMDRGWVLGGQGQNSRSRNLTWPYASIAI